ncbi:MAG TPA: 30S ribosomal protein S6 [Bacilli bacterium]|jgi:ribosomal protein S6|nr:MAG: 30S ribosomal protein S6 [Mycoplasma sp. CAG:611_25_7]HJJ08069.1 30S ribosomal protein S6 [Bacilli bacterium]
MNNYELMFIVRPTLDEASIKKVYEDMQNVVTKSKGKILSSKEMGQKELAYEIEGYKKGYYFLLVVEANKETVAEFNRIANVNENVIRHLIIKQEN